METEHCREHPEVAEKLLATRLRSRYAQELSNKCTTMSRKNCLGSGELDKVWPNLTRLARFSPNWALASEHRPGFASRCSASGCRCRCSASTRGTSCIACAASWTAARPMFGGTPSHPRGHPRGGTAIRMTVRTHHRSTPWPRRLAWQPRSCLRIVVHSEGIRISHTSPRSRERSGCPGWAGNESSVEHRVVCGIGSLQQNGTLCAKRRDPHLRFCVACLGDPYCRRGFPSSVAGRRLASWTSPVTARCRPFGVEKGTFPLRPWAWRAADRHGTSEIRGAFPVGCSECAPTQRPRP